MKKAVVIFSGGLDSTVLLRMLNVECQGAVRAISFDYGQRHARELESARTIAAFIGVEHRVVTFGDIAGIFGGSSQTDMSIDVPEGHYAASNMLTTVVPNRNMVMLAIATAWAIATESDVVAYGAHHGDHAIYPDCRESFVIAMNAAIRAAVGDERTTSQGGVTLQTAFVVPKIIAPFQYLSKANIVNIGVSLSVPFEVTWSCYKGGARHCGKCGTCVERREAFEIARVVDPTSYESDDVTIANAGAIAPPAFDDDDEVPF